MTRASIAADPRAAGERDSRRSDSYATSRLPRRHAARRCFGAPSWTRGACGTRAETWGRSSLSPAVRLRRSPPGGHAAASGSALLVAFPRLRAGRPLWGTRATCGNGIRQQQREFSDKAGQIGIVLQSARRAFLREQGLSDQRLRFRRHQFERSIGARIPRESPPQAGHRGLVSIPDRLAPGILIRVFQKSCRGEQRGENGFPLHDTHASRVKRRPQSRPRRTGTARLPAANAMRVPSDFLHRRAAPTNQSNLWCSYTRQALTGLRQRIRTSSQSRS